MMLILLALPFASGGGITCGAGTLLDDKTASCVVDPAILADHKAHLEHVQARTARAAPPNEV